MDTVRAILNLSRFVNAIASDGVTSRQEYSVWAKKHSGFMDEVFEYERKPGMPEMRVLLRPFFHPQLPLIGLNYSPVAHNTLHAYPTGWTDSLRQCRGIVFERSGALVAKPFPKFFNYGEHPETIKLPSGQFDATAKEDGHLGIIFDYQERSLLTTRGDFTSRTAVLGNDILARHVKKHDWWSLRFPRHITLLVEIIHPATRVYLDYHGREDLVIIGAYDRKTFYDFDYRFLQLLGKNLDLPVAERWTGRSVRDLRALMQDRTVRNREGFVARFANGLRVKFKFETYIGMMVEGKLTYAYLMNRMISGNLKRMLGTLEEEIFPIAEQMCAEIQSILAMKATAREKWRNLYGLVSPEEATPYYKNICRRLVKERG
jgi:hypothetical protein